MRRFLLFATGMLLVLLLAACGNKGPLVRAPAQPQTAATSMPATASTVPDTQP